MYSGWAAVVVVDAAQDATKPGGAGVEPACGRARSGVGELAGLVVWLSGVVGDGLGLVVIDTEELGGCGDGRQVAVAEEVHIGAAAVPGEHVGGVAADEQRVEVPAVLIAVEPPAPSFEFARSTCIQVVPAPSLASIIPYVLPDHGPSGGCP